MKKVISNYSICTSSIRKSLPLALSITNETVTHELCEILFLQEESERGDCMGCKK